MFGMEKCTKVAYRFSSNLRDPIQFISFQSINFKLDAVCI